MDLGGIDTGLAAMLAVTAAGLALALRIVWRTGRWRRPARLHAAQRGTATLEFALVLPIVLALVLMLLQTALVMGGQLFVHYAAFAATRSAIVQVPSQQPGEPRNVIVLAEGWAKFDAIRRAAVVAVTPISGDHKQASDTALRDALEHYFAAHGHDPPPWIEERVARRMRYADHYTRVTLLRAIVDPDNPGAGPVEFDVLLNEHEFGERDPVTVRVEHRLNLSIPYARMIFADGTFDQAGAYRRVTAQYTLTNEGVDPSLPEEPELPRRDQWEPE